MFHEKCRKVKFEDGDIMISISSDSVGITKNKGSPYSLTPILIRILNLPLWLRSRVEFVWLWALIPGPKPFKCSEMYLEFLVPELKELANGIIIPFDAHSGEYNVRRKVHLLFTVNDLRAVPKLNGQKQSPSRVGACNICHQVGFKLGPYPIYPGSISYILRVLYDGSTEEICHWNGAIWPSRSHHIVKPMHQFGTHMQIWIKKIVYIEESMHSRLNYLSSKHSYTTSMTLHTWSLTWPSACGHYSLILVNLNINNHIMILNPDLEILT